MNFSADLLRRSAVAAVVALAGLAGASAQGAHARSEASAPKGYGASPSPVVEVAGSGYFATGFGGTGGRLYRTDGTSAGTKPVPGVPSEARFGVNLTAGNGLIYFEVEAGNARRPLWQTDGTAAGTRPAVAGDAPDVALVAIAPGGAYVTTRSGEKRVWWLDSTTRLLREVGTLQGEILGATTTPGGPVYVQARDAAGAMDLIRATPEGLTLLNAGAPVQVSGAALGERFYFAGYDAAHGLEPWVTDGTPAGTLMVQDLTPGPTSSEFGAGFRAVGQSVFVTTSGSATRSPSGWRPLEMHRVTDQAVIPLTTPEGGRVTSFGSNVVKAGGTVVFGGAARILGSQNPDFEFPGLWTVDHGATIARRLTSSAPEDLTAVGNQAFFAVDYDGATLWRTDGTDAGTVAVSPLTSGACFRAQCGLPLTNFGALGNDLYFARTPGDAAGPELWRTDGTEAGTRLVTTPGQIGVVGATTTLSVGRAVDRKAPFRYSMSGRVTFPQLADAQTLCKGSVTLRAVRSTKVIRRKAALQFTDGICSYRTLLQLSAKDLGRKGRRASSAGKLRVTAQVDRTDHVVPDRESRVINLRFGR